MMVSLRYATKSTSDNVWALCDLIRDNKCDEIILFASVGNDIDEEEARWNNNLPLVVALAKYIIPHVASVLVVFDGVCLTAVRSARYGEVRELLDVAIASDKVYYSGQRACLRRCRIDPRAEILLSPSEFLRTNASAAFR